MQQQRPMLPLATQSHQTYVWRDRPCALAMELLSPVDGVVVVVRQSSADVDGGADGVSGR